MGLIELGSVSDRRIHARLSSLVSFCDELGHGVRVMGAMRQKRIDSEDKVREI
jgi:hypothetical protein